VISIFFFLSFFLT